MQQVICSTTLVLFACIEVINLRLEHLVLGGLDGLHLFKPCHFSLQSLFSKMGVFVLNVVILLLSQFLVSHREVFVKSLLFCLS